MTLYVLKRKRVVEILISNSWAFGLLIDKFRREIDKERENRERDRQTQGG